MKPEIEIYFYHFFRSPSIISRFFISTLQNTSARRTRVGRPKRPASSVGQPLRNNEALPCRSIVETAIEKGSSVDNHATITKILGSETKAKSCPLADASLRSLQRIQLEGILLHFLLDVGGKIARSLGPLDRRLTIGLAIRPGRVLHYPIAPLAGFDDGIAFSAVVGTAVLLHEDTLRSRLDRLTNHGNQPPFSFE